MLGAMPRGLTTILLEDYQKQKSEIHDESETLDRHDCEKARAARRTPSLYGSHRAGSG
jgi:hypothetical protein